jgi:hypothetical protein
MRLCVEFEREAGNWRQFQHEQRTGRLWPNETAKEPRKLMGSSRKVSTLTEDLTGNNAHRQHMPQYGMDLNGALQC